MRIVETTLVTAVCEHGNKIHALLIFIHSREYMRRQRSGIAEPQQTQQSLIPIASNQSRDLFLSSSFLLPTFFPVGSSSTAPSTAVDAPRTAPWTSLVTAILQPLSSSSSSSSSSSARQSSTTNARPPTGLAYHRDCAEHKPPHHPFAGEVEVPERTTLTFQHIAACGLTRACVQVPVVEATAEQLSRAHDPTHIMLVNSTAVHGVSCIAGARQGGDLYASEGTARAARLAAGGVTEAALRVARGELSNALCILRPPGHHCSATRASGFCFFNNVAVAARAAQAEVVVATAPLPSNDSSQQQQQQRRGRRKVLIVDWDVHHGDGTEQIFYDDPSVLFISVHQHGMGQGHVFHRPHPMDLPGVRPAATRKRPSSPSASASGEHGNDDDEDEGEEQEDSDRKQKKQRRREQRKERKRREGEQKRSSAPAATNNNSSNNNDDEADLLALLDADDDEKDGVEAQQKKMKEQQDADEERLLAALESGDSDNGEPATTAAVKTDEVDEVKKEEIKKEQQHQEDEQQQQVAVSGRRLRARKPLVLKDEDLDDDAAMQIFENMISGIGKNAGSANKKDDDSDEGDVESSHNSSDDRSQKLPSSGSSSADDDMDGDAESDSGSDDVAGRGGGAGYWDDESSASSSEQEDDDDGEREKRTTGRSNNTKIVEFTASPLESHTGRRFHRGYNPDGRPFYPGTGFAEKVGRGDGAGFNINIPWPCTEFGDVEYLRVMQELIIPAAKEFAPDLIIVSSGMDCADGDLLGDQKVTPTGMFLMTSLLSEQVTRKIVVVLEGGYKFRNVALCSEAVLRALLQYSGAPPQGSEFPSPLTTQQQQQQRTLGNGTVAVGGDSVIASGQLQSTMLLDQCGRLVERVKQLHAPFWKCFSKQREIRNTAED